MKKIKKLGSAFMAFIIAISVTACAGSDYIGKVNGIDIRHGVYLYLTLDAIAQGESAVYEQETSSDEESSDTETSTEEKSFFDKSIGEKSTLDWVNEKVDENLLQYAAVESEFERLGLTLDEDDEQLIKDTVKSTWESEYYYEQYGITFSQVFADQGITTKGDYYEKQGISEQSYKAIITNSQKRQKLFSYYYAEGGEKAVSAEDKLSYFKENFVRVKYIAMNPDDQNLDDDEKALEATKKQAEELVKKLKDGEKFSVVSEEYDEWVAKQSESDDSSSSSSSSSTSDDSSVKTEDDYDVLISKETTSFTEEFIEKIFSMPETAEPEIVEENGYVMIVLREDISKRTDWIETYDENILIELKNDEFTEYLDTSAKDYSIDISDSNRKKYAPNKIKTVEISQ